MQNCNPSVIYAKSTSSQPCDIVPLLCCCVARRTDESQGVDYAVIVVSTSLGCSNELPKLDDSIEDTQSGGDADADDADADADADADTSGWTPTRIRMPTPMRMPMQMATVVRRESSMASRMASPARRTWTACR